MVQLDVVLAERGQDCIEYCVYNGEDEQLVCGHSLASILFKYLNIYA